MLKYISDNYVLLVMLIGMFIMTLHDVFLDRDMILKLRLCIVSIFALSVFNVLETYFGYLDHVTIWRYIFSSTCYSLRPVIIMFVIFIIYKKAPKIIIIPALINIVLSYLSIFTGIVYAFDENNSFRRGILGYTPYIVSGIYVFGLLFISIRVISDHSLEESSIVFFISFAAIGAALLSLYADDTVLLADHTYGASVLIYYLYTYFQFTKKDSLTGLLNRQSYYAYIEKYGESISSAISIDMNELKWLNDTMGHSAGDRGIKTVSECLRKGLSKGDKLYRVGGDEFILLSHKKNPEELDHMVETMRNAVNECGYSCAFGYSIGGKINDILKKADKKMYADKARIKSDMQSQGIKLHPRD